MNENYPSDWFCTCGHMKKQHIGLSIWPGAYVFTINEDSPEKEKYDTCFDFTPLDNLTQVEKTYNEKLSS